MSQEGRETKLPNTETTVSNTALQKVSVPLKPQILPQVLVVDDDPDVLAMVREFLEGQFIVRTASSGKEALEKVKTNDPQIMLTDFRLPDTDGLELIRRALNLKSTLHIFLMTGKGTAHLRDRALRQGALRFLEKPLNLDRLLKDLLEIAHRSFGWAGNGIDVLDLTQIMLLCRKHGVVQFGEGDQLGLMVFENGKIVHASSGERQGENAYYAMTYWRECPFQTLPGKHPELRHNISTATEALVLEGARLRDEREFQALEASMPPVMVNNHEVLAKITEDTVKQAREILEGLLEEDSVDTAILLDCGGFVLDFASKQPHFRTDPVESVISTCVGSSQIIGRKLQFGETAFSTYEFDEGALLIKMINNCGILALLVDTSANLGLIRLQVRKVSQKLESLLA